LTDRLTSHFFDLGLAVAGKRQVKAGIACKERFQDLRRVNTLVGNARKDLERVARAAGMFCGLHRHVAFGRQGGVISLNALSKPRPN